MTLGACLRNPNMLLGIALSIVLVSPMPAAAAERYALIVTGASGGDQYGAAHETVRIRLITILRTEFGYPEDHLIVLGASTQPGVREATRVNVRAAIATLAKRASKDDVVLVMLVGHGTVFTGSDAKFNLVGPDMTAEEWETALEAINARLIFVNTAPGSYPYLQTLAKAGRVVVTATDATSQRYETLFPQFFVQGLEKGQADLDKDGRVSIWEAFSFASAKVKDAFTARGRLATERALLDDTGAGVGRDAESAGRDGALAQVTFLEPDRPPVTATGSAPAEILDRRAAITSQLELLRARRDSMPAEEYERQLEALLLELARLDRRLRGDPQL